MKYIRDLQGLPKETLACSVHPTLDMTKVNILTWAGRKRNPANPTQIKEQWAERTDLYSGR